LDAGTYDFVVTKGHLPVEGWRNLLAGKD